MNDKHKAFTMNVLQQAIEEALSRTFEDRLRTAFMNVAKEVAEKTIREVSTLIETHVYHNISKTDLMRELVIKWYLNDEELFKKEAETENKID